jgi:TatD DNase family protein
MIDTHCHLTDPRLGAQLDQVLHRARAAGVGRMITVGTDLADGRAAVALCHRHPEVRCGVGIHPNHSHQASVADVATLASLQADPAVVALGEMGLDYFHKFAPRAHQAAIFEAQLELASRVSRPVIIHCREAVADCLAILRRFPSVRCVFHCFTGSADEARRVLDAGHLLSFTGVITFKNNDALREVVKLTPLDRLLLETDAPYLSPEPMRKQKINEPALVVHTAARIAQLKHVPVEELDRVTTDNALRFFRWDPPS